MYQKGFLVHMRFLQFSMYKPTLVHKHNLYFPRISDIRLRFFFGIYTFQRYFYRVTILYTWELFSIYVTR